MDFQDFLKNTEWEGADPHWFTADWSTRHYGRLTNARGHNAILLKSPTDDAPDSVAGHKLGAWVILNRHFRKIGLNTPEIYAEDTANGFVLMEDFGEQSLGGQGDEAYLAATDVLVAMRDATGAQDIDLLQYEDTHVRAALRFYPQYILKQDGATDEWFAAWEATESALPPCPRALTHIDFFANNLMWLPNRRGTDRIGILDFQAACKGPFTYDMANLMDDARREFPDALKQACFDRYCADLTAADKQAFDAWYPVMAAQFHARVLGQIVKLGVERNRTDLMVFYKPLTARFEKELHDPSLRFILDFIKKYSA